MVAVLTLITCHVLCHRLYAMQSVDSVVVLNDENPQAGAAHKTATARTPFMARCTDFADGDDHFEGQTSCRWLGGQTCYERVNDDSTAPWPRRLRPSVRRLRRAHLRRI